MLLCLNLLLLLALYYLLWWFLLKSFAIIIYQSLIYRGISYLIHLWHWHLNTLPVLKVKLSKWILCHRLWLQFNRRVGMMLSKMQLLAQSYIISLRFFSNVRVSNKEWLLLTLVSTACTASHTNRLILRLIVLRCKWLWM